MIETPFFSTEEYEARLERVRQRMVERHLDACLLSMPENIYYLTGLNYQGYFGFHLLVVPREGEMVLVVRAMERATLENQLDSRTRYEGFEDGADPAQCAVNVIRGMGLQAARLGLEMQSMYLRPYVVDGLRAELPQAHCFDATELVSEIRFVQSPRELDYTRRAAAISEAMMRAALETARPGVSEKEIAAEVYRTMVMAGGDIPGFHPFIRSTPRLGRAHETWTDRVLASEDTLFVELSGCVGNYHAPMGRLITFQELPPQTADMAQVCLEAFAAVVDAVRPGVRAGLFYLAGLDRVHRAGLSHFNMHHCGYLVGIGFAPSWVGGGAVIGLRRNSEVELRAGMVFHLMSWLIGAGRGDYFVSDTAVVTEHGCEMLTRLPQLLRAK
ncbi:MAG: M24 family metallopeptidase [Anaerolineales bacterium]